MASTTAAFVPVRTATIHKIAQSPLATSTSIHQPSTIVATMPNTLTFDRNTSHNHQRRMTKMNMVAGNGAAAVMGIVSGGILGGALHAIAGEFENVWEFHAH